MNALVRVRYKVVTSFIIAALGAVAGVRLAQETSPSLPVFMGLAVCGIFVVAGIWRGVEYARLARKIKP